MAGGLNQATGSRLMNPQHALLQAPAGAGVNAITVRGQRILSSQRREARITSQREHLSRDGLRKEKATCQQSGQTRSPSTTTSREQECPSSISRTSRLISPLTLLSSPSIQSNSPASHYHC